MLEVILYILVGLALFFVGMHLAERGLVLGSGAKLQRILQLFTANAITGVLTGTLVTALVQSSSAVSVMVIGFVSAGVMTLYQGMGVILGANIGTTVTMHILALKMTNLEWWLMAIGIIIMIWGWVQNQKSFTYGGQVLFGFGVIFFGLNLLQAGVSPLQYNPAVMRWLLVFGDAPVLGVVAGMVFTAIIQSSSATSGIVLTIVRQGMISFTGALGIILGANVGTCVTALLAGVRASQTARRLAYFHVLFNTYGVLFFLPFITQFSTLIMTLESEPGRQIALAHTIFNVVTTLLILPFLRLIERFLKPTT